MCTIARTSKAVFQAFVDLDPLTERPRFLKALNLKLEEEKDRALADAAVECGKIIEARQAEIEELTKARDALKSDRDLWREKARALKRVQGKRRPYKQKQTNRIMRLVAKKGKQAWDEIGGILGLNPRTVESRYFCELRRLKKQMK